ncbi:unnamed protein product [Brachionus calyciflorus]|uniref:Uncharacterized protein n=1 Tax=Brachionus calyciflorus TaxID=104777 RepID=A0A813ZF29_9BILA|nr:unnamed protein product [Brachionus calyciflorus]
MFFKILLINLILIISRIVCVRFRPTAVSSSANSECFPIRNEPYSIICRSLPDFDQATINFFSKYKKIVFDLENKYTLSSRDFYNCSFSWSNRIDIVFKNIKKLSSFTFDSIKIEDSTVVSIQFDGTGLNLDKHKSDSRLLINENAFYNIILGKKSQIKIEIKNYKSLLIKDNLVQNLAWQSELSEIGISLSNIDEIKYKNRNGKNLDDELSDYDTDELESSSDLPTFLPSKIHTLKNNLTYSLQITNSQSLIFDPLVFSGVLINSFSDFNILIKNVNGLFLGDNLFDSLLLGYYAKFNFIIENLSKISLGKSMFNSLQTDQYSVFYFHVENVKLAANTSLDNQYSDVFEDYTDYYDDDYEQMPISNYNDWLSIPDGFFKNVRMSDSSIVQVHFTNLDSSISFSPYCFKEIELGLDAKFQLMLQDISGHVILSENSFNLIKVLHGLFEFWVDSQKKTINSYINTFKSSKEIDLVNLKSPNKILNNAQNKYVKFLDNSINKIFLTSGSNFRFGFLNSNSVILINSKSITDIHIDRFDKAKSTLDYKTKLEFDISDTDNFLFDFESLNYQDSEDLSLSKLIEIDGYKPIVTLIKSDKTEIIYPENTKIDKNFKRKLLVQRSDSMLTHEFCRFYKLRPFMVNFNTIKSNLVYFSQTSLSDYVSDSSLSSTKTCTSCLLIYLYRTIHRRIDFLYVKDHLPSCFINLHFSDESKFELLNSKNSNLKAGYIKRVEDSFQNYWKLLNCKELTGLSLILNYDPDTTPSDESKENYELISHKCNESDRVEINKEIDIIQKIDSNLWSEISNRIYLKNKIDSKLNGTRVQVETSLFKKKTNSKKNSLSTTSWFFICIILFSCLGLAFFIVSKNRPKKPCLRLTLYRGKQNFQRLEYTRNAHNSSLNNVDNDEEFTAENNDELNGFEYDDEFELNENADNLDADSSENVDIKIIDASNSTPLANFKTKSLNQIKRLKDNILNNKDMLRTGLLNVTNLSHTHFKKSGRNSKYPSYSYKSTDSTMVQNSNDYELKEDEFKLNSVVTYDVKNQKSIPIVDRSVNLGGDIVEEPPQVMRLSTNPLDNLELVDDKIKMKQKNSLESTQEGDANESNA